MPLRIAMWSGPRNISTAMMRSWGNRPDTFVWDEPFYPYYLQATGREDFARAASEVQIVNPLPISAMNAAPSPITEGASDPS